MEGFIALLWVIGYLAIGVIVAIVYEIHDQKAVEDKDDKDTGSSFGIVIMWPLVIAVYVVFILIIGKADNFVKWAAKSIKLAYKNRGQDE